MARFERPAEPPDDDADFDEDFLWECWSCHREMADGTGISVDDSDDEQICRECWGQVPVTARLWLGMLFRSFSSGGIGLAEVMEGAMRDWPFGASPSRN